MDTQKDQIGDMVNVKRLNLLSYKILFGDKSLLLDRYAARTTTHDVILGIFAGDLCVGAMVLLERSYGHAAMELSYITILEEYRGRGLGMQFVKAACEYVRNLGIHSISVHVNRGREHKELFDRCGFECSYKLRIIHCDVTEASQRIWQAKKERLFDKMQKHLLHKGFQVTSFADACKEDIAQIVQNESGFDPSLSPGEIIMGLKGRFLKEYSYLCMKDDKAAAVTLMLQADAESLVFQLISVAEPFKNTGALMLPVLKSMERIFSFEYKRVSYCIQNTNLEMKKVAEKLFGDLTTRTAVQQCCIKKV